MTFYIYIWLREDGTPYYVGKGSGRRAYEKRKIGPCPPKDRILIRDTFNEEEALEMERMLISFYGRADLGMGCLQNKASGGQAGATGAIRSQEFRRNLSQIKKGNKYSVGYKNSLGHKVSEPEIQKRRERMIGNQNTLGHHLSEEHKDKIRTWCKNRPPEMLERIKTALIGNKNGLGHKHSGEARKRMSDSRKGKPWTEARRTAEMKRTQK